MKKDKYLAFEACNADYETFETFEEAVKWLNDYDEDGITEEAENGGNFIAKITHRSKFVETDRKENYHQHTDECPEDCNEEEWPYIDYDYVGKIVYEEVKK